ncbi:D-alanyl-D-alanine carboxypeptidase [Nonomuraea solani]|uniref:D-alanyl-D-alanine carboxypeptidase n=1 Tax=Nonomuraea solani TaxID=1144553 RepID=A0A1H6EUK4_9ACTN|nr:serine hydrolase domain-containing protein [Nonomuraea solani]SEH01570.1 D-alanyl-D-alanine carboxypeptidase [Nonomuraea solani]
MSKKSLRVLAAAALAGLVLAGTPAAAAADPVQKKLDALVKTDKFPAALGAVQDAKGRTRHYTAGVGNLKTGAKVPVDGRVRIGSNTKMFVSVVVLQLVAEGKIGLDDPIETYLPKVVRGKAGDGRKITVRQLLQHTSGLPNYTRWLPSIFKTRYAYRSPQDLLDMAFKHKASFAPGTSWEYSNTGYVLLGLIIEKLDGRPVARSIDERIIEPLGLRDTYWPAKRDRTIRGPHPKGYAAKKPGGKLLDITNLDPSWGWAAGQLIGTPSDLNRFMTALMDGKLLEPEQLAAMKKTVKAPGMPAGWEYGLGLMKMSLTCGDVAWGHGGDIDGYETRNGITDDGRAVTLAVTALPTAEPAMLNVIGAMDTALCAKR